MTTDRRFPIDPFMAVDPRALEAIAAGLFVLPHDAAQAQVQASIAVVCIEGPLMQRGGFWYDGYAAIQSRFAQALADPAVRTVVLKINSPGGVVVGCFEAARAMIDAKTRARKRVIAFADESAFSAAYAIACVADEIVVPPEGGVGSVGVIGALVDWSAANERFGIKVTVITSGAQKADGHPDVPLTDAAKKRYQARIDSLARSFAELVGDQRELTVGEVLGLEAACVYGVDAVAKGLADRVSSYEALISDLTTPTLSGDRQQTGVTMSKSALTPADLEYCEKWNLDPKAFAASRVAEASSSSQATPPSSMCIDGVELSASDLDFCERYGIEPAAFAKTRAEELARIAEAKS